MSSSKQNNRLADQAQTEGTDATPSTSHNLGCDDTELPTYAEHEMSLRDQVQQLVDEARKDGAELPITKHPEGPHIYNNQHLVFKNQPHDVAALYRRCRKILETYFDAIEARNDEMVALLIESGLVTTETTNQHERTPLIAAVEAGNVRTVQQLMDFDADVNAFGGTIIYPLGFYSGKKPENTYRTPLQYAAEKGNLTIVKLLMETYQADDSLIAPDGQHALRLAAANGYKEIVDYLPSRRGGGWRRWKTKHRYAMLRVKRATRNIYKFFKILLWYTPKFLLWDMPRELIVQPLIRSFRWLKDHHKDIPGLIAAWLKKLPPRIWESLKKIPGAVQEILQEIVRFIWRFIISIPKTVKLVSIWTWGGLKKFGTAVRDILSRFLSLLHTIITAIATFFRDLTLSDVLRGFKTFLHGIFVDFPKKLWEWLCKFGDVSYEVLKALFGNVGWALWWMGRGILELLIYVPKKLAIIFVEFFKSLGNGFHELMIWIDPKRA
jgi:hypothetical protein